MGFGCIFVFLCPLDVGTALLSTLALNLSMYIEVLRLLSGVPRADLLGLFEGLSLMLFPFFLDFCRTPFVNLGCLDEVLIGRLLLGLLVTF